MQVEFAQDLRSLRWRPFTILFDYVPATSSFLPNQFIKGSVLQTLMRRGVVGQVFARCSDGDSGKSSTCQC